MPLSVSACRTIRRPCLSHVYVHRSASVVKYAVLQRHSADSSGILFVCIEPISILQKVRPSCYGDFLLFHASSEGPAFKTTPGLKFPNRKSLFRNTLAFRASYRLADAVALCAPRRSLRRTGSHNGGTSRHDSSRRFRAYARTLFSLLWASGRCRNARSSSAYGRGDDPSCRSIDQ